MDLVKKYGEPRTRENIGNVLTQGCCKGCRDGGGEVESGHQKCNSMDSELIQLIQDGKLDCVEGDGSWWVVMK
ncbi:MAG: hypothetical protein PVJ09_02110 [Candidatus Woesebacteria bacterium]|jgi:hypothetical protein